MHAILHALLVSALVWSVAFAALADAKSRKQRIRRHKGKTYFSYVTHEGEAVFVDSIEKVPKEHKLTVREVDLNEIMLLAQQKKAEKKLGDDQGNALKKTIDYEGPKKLNEPSPACKKLMREKKTPPKMTVAAL